MLEVYVVEAKYYGTINTDFDMNYTFGLCANKEVAVALANKSIKEMTEDHPFPKNYRIRIIREWVIDSTDYESLEEQPNPDLIGEYGVFDNDPMPQWRFYE